MSHRYRLSSWRHGGAAAAVLGCAAGAIAVTLPSLSPARAAEDPFQLVNNVASCVVDAATTLKSPTDPLTVRYVQRDRTALAQTCGGDPATYSAQRSVLLRFESPSSPGSVGLQEMLRCQDLSAGDAVGDYVRWNQRNMCVARFEWIDDAQGTYYEFAVFRGEMNSAFSWRTWLRTDDPGKHAGARHIKGLEIPRGTGPEDPPPGTGPVDPGGGVAPF